ncbi:hypothetical protein [Aurantimonas marina]|uniref:hypothetical protein n=1 Tax=Aurantimonas marina TaxID=2780508 RepID=UPI0019D07EE3|nr:hypothetical protein [Aurantimonas marina]
MVSNRALKSAGGLAALAFVVFATGVEAKPAKCFSTDDGYYACDFEMTDSAGSFTIEGPGVTYILLVDSPGYASGFVNLGNRNIPLAGTYVRERDDPACWANAETNTKICAW